MPTGDRSVHLLHDFSDSLIEFSCVETAVGSGTGPGTGAPNRTSSGTCKLVPTWVQVRFYCLINGSGSGSGSTVDLNRNRPIYNPKYRLSHLLPWSSYSSNSLFHIVGRFNRAKKHSQWVQMRFNKIIDKSPHFRGSSLGRPF